MPDPTTPAKGLTQPTVGADNNTWGGLLNTNLALIDSAIGGTLALSISGNVSLSSVQAQNGGYEFTGTLSGTATITWPTFKGIAVIQNGTTGGFSITCGISGGTVTVLDGETVAIWSDGTNFARLAQVGGGATVSNADLQHSSITIAGHTVSLGGTQTLAASDLTNGTTGSGDVVLATSAGLTGPFFGATNASAFTATSTLTDGASSHYAFVVNGATNMNGGQSYGGIVKVTDTAGNSGTHLVGFDSTLTLANNAAAYTEGIYGIVSGLTAPQATAYPGPAFRAEVQDLNGEQWGQGYVTTDGAAPIAFEGGATVANTGSTTANSQWIMLDAYNGGTKVSSYFFEETTGSIAWVIANAAMGISPIGHVNSASNYSAFTLDNAFGGMISFSAAGTTEVYRVLADTSGATHNLTNGGHFVIQYAGTTELDYNSTNSGKWTFATPVVLPHYTVSTLPAGVLGARAVVTDATGPTFLGTLTGGGSTVCPVTYNGSAWVAG